MQAVRSPNGPQESRAWESGPSWGSAALVTCAVVGEFLETRTASTRPCLAALVRVMEQALRDGIIDRNPARITGWQRSFIRAEDELDDPRPWRSPTGWP